MIEQPAVFADLRPAQYLHGFGHADLRHEQRRAELSYLGGALVFARGKKVAWPGFHLDATALQAGGEAKREILRHHDPPNASLTQQHWDHVGKTRPLGAVAPQLLLIAAERKDATMPRLLPGAVDLQVAHHHIVPAAAAQEDKRVRHEHADRIEHIGVMLAIGHYQQMFRVLHLKRQTAGRRHRRARGEYSLSR